MASNEGVALPAPPLSKFISIVGLKIGTRVTRVNYNILCVVPTTLISEITSQ